MTWPAFFLGCFVIGFVLSAMSLAGSAFGVHFHMHLPFVHHVQVHGGPAVHASGGVAPVNFPTLMAFLAWFGGTGYLLTSEFGWLAVPAVVGAVLMGVVGSALVFWVMAHVLWSPEENMQSADTRMIGVLGHLSHSIRSGGIGELIYSQGGVRRSCGATSADGQPIERGAEVIVTAYERGIAHVRRWEDLEGEDKSEGGAVWGSTR